MQNPSRLCTCPRCGSDGREVSSGLYRVHQLRYTKPHDDPQPPPSQAKRQRLEETNDERQCRLGALWGQIRMQDSAASTSSLPAFHPLRRKQLKRRRSTQAGIFRIRRRYGRMPMRRRRRIILHQSRTGRIGRTTAAMRRATLIPTSKTTLTAAEMRP
ncbi:uncharacterized protein SPSC_03455 [Sporisorium scitamineum]|uniref:Uncharacterized protein n=1 Tax=Sporisorium scitamineum TaxID=49012 RepID=A0A140KMW4_9BASI|nr:uncharacterized protein SPSC_03455 [Sporisorium scitamineum]